MQSRSIPEVGAIAGNTPIVNVEIRSLGRTNASEFVGIKDIGFGAASLVYGCEVVESLGL